MGCEGFISNVHGGDGWSGTDAETTSYHGISNGQVHVHFQDSSNSTRVCIQIYLYQEEPHAGFPRDRLALPTSTNFSTPSPIRNPGPVPQIHHTGCQHQQKLTQFSLLLLYLNATQPVKAQRLSTAPLGKMLLNAQIHQLPLSECQHDSWLQPISSICHVSLHIIISVVYSAQLNACWQKGKQF